MNAILISGTNEEINAFIESRKDKHAVILDADDSEKTTRKDGDLPKSNKPHARLRSLAKEYDMTGEYLARKLGASASYISHKFTGKIPWTVWEMYTLMDFLGIAPSEIADYFPDYRPEKTTKKGGKKK